MSLQKDIAIVLRRLDYSETSQVLAVFTREHGQERLIAKGVKRSTKTRVAVGIDLLERGRVVFSRRPGKTEGLATLTEWQQEDTFPHLRRDLVRQYAALYAAEVTAHLTEAGDPHPALFDGLERFLRELAEGDAVASLVGYSWLLLKEIGLLPELGRCRSCRREVEAGEDAYFSSREGGVICRDCEPAVVEKRRIDGAARRALREPGAADATALRAAFGLVDYHFTETMARVPRVAGMLRSALNGYD